MAAARRKFACVLLLLCAYCVNSQTTQSANQTGTGSSSTSVTNDGSILDESMDVFYKMVKTFLNTVQTKTLRDQEWFNISSIIEANKHDLSSGRQFVAPVLPEAFTNWKNWSSYLIGFSICAAVGIVFILVMPCVGFCLCCFRCCGRCGGRKKEKDPRHAKCKRTTYCFTLLILTTVMLAGVVCAYVANNLLHTYLQNENNRGPVGNLRSAFSGINDYIDDTINDVQVRALGSFDSTRDTLVTNINSTLANAIDGIADSLNATALIKQAEELSKDVNSTREDLEDVARYLGYLQSDGTALSESLAEIKNNLTSECTTSGCNVDTSNYESDANFTDLANLKAEANNVAVSLDMQTYINQAKDSLEQAKIDGKASIQQEINNAIATLDSTRAEIKNQTDQLKSQFKEATSFSNDAMVQLNNTLVPVKKYSNYIYYAGIGVCSIYLLITVCYYLGVLFGVCGERPGYDAPACNRGIGANFLMAGAGISFLLSWLLMLLILIAFIIGGIGYTQICRYVDTHDPNDLQFLADVLQNSFNISERLYNKPNVKFDLVETLNNCKDNEPVYKALNLGHVYNISGIISLDEIDSQIDAISQQSITLPTISLITPELKAKIDQFGDAGVDGIDFTVFDAQTQKKLTKANLTVLANDLDTKADTLGGRPKLLLKEHATELRRLDTVYVVNMTSNVEKLSTALNSLKLHTDIKAKTNALVANLQKSEEAFNNNSKAQVTNIVKTLTTSMKTIAKNGINSLISDVENEVGRCRPIYDSLYLATDSICVTILNPFNSLWFSWGWCIFFFIPSIIFSIKLAGLYRREEEYSEKDFEEANFSMYGGGQTTHDTIPLTSLDHRNGDARGRHPGVANTGYNDDGRRRGQPTYPNNYDFHYPPGSKEMPPPAYHGGRQSTYSNNDFYYDQPHYNHQEQRSQYPLRY